MSRHVWNIVAEFQGTTTLETWTEGHHAAAGTVQDMMEAMLTNNVSKITVTREPYPFDRDKE